MVLTGIPSKVIDTITKRLGLQTAIERSTFDLAPTIQPVVDINADQLTEVVKNTTLTDGTSAIIFATNPGKRDFYMTAYSLSVIKDSSSPSTFVNIKATVNGETLNVASIPGFALTAQQESIALALPNPIKVDRGTNVTVGSQSGTSSIRVSGVVYGYEVDA